MATVKIRLTGGYQRAVRWKGDAAAANDAAEPATIGPPPDSQSQLLQQRVFSGFVGIHPQFPVANVTPLVHLSLIPPSHSCVLAATAGRRPRLVFGHVRTMTTYVSKHYVPVNSTSSLSGIAYIGVQVYTRDRPMRFSSNTEPQLGSQTYIYVPATHFIFSFASFQIEQSRGSGDESHILYLTPSQEVQRLVRAAEKQEVKILAALASFKASLRKGGSASPESDDEDDEDEFEALSQDE
ncbi:hypothetical protein AURDEDRAFT_172935 [Auricularia subglabra TFB-10046 SS5]|nr:hypothetical protein AURDEDRAFT_172935 [Auricularia subglabra TFB-10046 SS5]